MTPFTLHYTLTRRQRVGELLPWLPALAGSIGFGIGVAVLASVVSPWFLFLLLLPVVYYRGLFALLFDFVFRPGQPVVVSVDETELVVTVGDSRRQLPLDGIIQVCRSGGDWVVLHRDGSAVTIPAGVIAADQLDFLKAFAMRAFAERKAAWKEAGTG